MGCSCSSEGSNEYGVIPLPDWCDTNTQMTAEIVRLARQAWIEAISDEAPQTTGGNGKDGVTPRNETPLSLSPSTSASDLLQLDTVNIIRKDNDASFLPLVEEETFETMRLHDSPAFGNIRGNQPALPRPHTLPPLSLPPTPPADTTPPAGLFIAVRHGGTGTGTATPNNGTNTTNDTLTLTDANVAITGVSTGAISSTLTTSLSPMMSPPSIASTIDDPSSSPLPSSRRPEPRGSGIIERSHRASGSLVAPSVATPTAAGTTHELSTKRLTQRQSYSGTGPASSPTHGITGNNNNTNNNSNGLTTTSMMTNNGTVLGILQAPTLSSRGRHSSGGSLFGLSPTSSPVGTTTTPLASPLPTIGHRSSSVRNSGINNNNNNNSNASNPQSSPSIGGHDRYTSGDLLQPLAPSILRRASRSASGTALTNKQQQQQQSQQQSQQQQATDPNLILSPGSVNGSINMSSHASQVAAGVASMSNKSSDAALSPATTTVSIAPLPTFRPLTPLRSPRTPSISTSAAAASAASAASGTLAGARSPTPAIGVMSPPTGPLSMGSRSDVNLLHLDVPGMTSVPSSSFSPLPYHQPALLSAMSSTLLLSTSNGGNSRPASSVDDRAIMAPSVVGSHGGASGHVYGHGHMMIQSGSAAWSMSSLYSGASSALPVQFGTGSISGTATTVIRTPPGIGPRLRGPRPYSMATNQLIASQLMASRPGPHTRFRAHLFYELLYRQLSSLDPSIDKLFHSKKQRNHDVPRLILYIVDSIDTFNDEATHAKFLSITINGMAMEQYAVVARGLLDAFKKMLGSRFTEDMKRAWTVVCSRFVMMVYKLLVTTRSHHQTRGSRNNGTETPGEHSVSTPGMSSAIGGNENTVNTIAGRGASYASDPVIDLRLPSPTSRQQHHTSLMIPTTPMHAGSANLYAHTPITSPTAHGQLSIISSPTGADAASAHGFATGTPPGSYNNQAGGNGNSGSNGSTPTAINGAATPRGSINASPVGGVGGGGTTAITLTSPVRGSLSQRYSNPGSNSLIAPTGGSSRTPSGHHIRHMSGNVPGVVISTTSGITMGTAPSIDPPPLMGGGGSGSGTLMRRASFGSSPKRQRSSTTSGGSRA